MNITKHCFFDVATGIFNGAAFYGTAEAALLQIEASAGSLGVHQGDVDHLRQRLNTNTGTLVDYQPPAPANDALKTWEWNASTKQWTSAPTLAALKSDKWGAIKVARSAVINAPLATAQGTFDGDLNSRNSLIGTALRAQMMASKLQTVAIIFTLADNTVVTLDLAKIISLVLLMGSREQSARDVATGLRADIFAATTATAIAAITWPT